MEIITITNNDVKIEQLKGEIDLTNKDFFFSYSSHMSRFLEEKGQKRILIALNFKTNKKFSLFYKNESFVKVLKEYKPYKNNKIK